MITDRLIEKIMETHNPTVVGLDPRDEFIPKHLIEQAFQTHEEPCRAMAWAFFMFNRALIDALWDIVPAVKPQMAFYEQYGSPGVACYVDTVRYAREKGLLVIGDAKRGDIAAVAQAYADAHIGKVMANGQAHTVYDTDYVTVNPYMGFDTVEPFLANARQYSKGIFALVKTSNPGTSDIQDLTTPSGKVYEVVADRVEKWSAETAGRYGFGVAGAVVGATHPAQARELRERMPHTYFLVPGYGAQGGTAEDVKVCFTSNGLGALINNSRGIMAAYQQKAYKERFSEEDFALAAREAALTMRNELGFQYEKNR